MKKIQKLEWYQSLDSDGKVTTECPPSIDEITSKLNEVIDSLNKLMEFVARL